MLSVIYFMWSIRQHLKQIKDKKEQHCLTIINQKYEEKAMKRIIACSLALSIIAFGLCSAAMAATRRSSETGNSGNNIFWWFIGIMAAFLVLSVVIGVFSAVNRLIEESQENELRRLREAEKERQRMDREAGMSAQRQFVAQQRRLMSDSLRYDVLRRDGFRCQICGATQKDGVKLHVDHIFPVSKGGKTEISNLRTLCERCNMGKRDKVENVEPFLDPYDDFDFDEPPVQAKKSIKSVAIVDEYGREILDPRRTRKRRKR